MPNFVIDPAEGDEEFVSLIQKKLATLDLSRDFNRYKWLEPFLRIHASEGFASAAECLLDLEKGLTAKAQVSIELAERYAGEVLLSTFTPGEVAKFLPYNDVVVEPKDNTFNVSFSSLDTEIVDDQRYRLSRRKPTVLIDGKERILLFTSEAIYKVCKRIVPDFRKYMKLGTAHSFFADCVYFESTFIRPEGIDASAEFVQPAIGLFQQCFLHKFHPGVSYPEIQIFLDVAMNDERLRREGLSLPCYFRVGYCPIQVTGNHAIATTFLKVGFSKTKERALLMSSLTLSVEKKRKYIQVAKRNDGNSAFDPEESELRCWFHQNGLPQVIAMEDTVFAGEAVGGIGSAPLMQILMAEKQTGSDSANH